MRLKIAHYPNNEIRVSLTQEASPVDIIKADQAETHETQLFLCPKDEATDSGDRPPLDIRGDFRESGKTKLRSGFGLLPRKTVFGLNGKRTIQRVGGVFDRRFPKEECLFLTGTLPGSTPEALRAIAAWSGYIVDRLKSWLNYYAAGVFDFYVWEWQKRGALHLHYCLHVPSADNRQRVVERFHSEWVSILRQVSERSGTDLFARSKGGSWANLPGAVKAVAQVVRKSVAAYLAKYCSKGHDTSSAFHCPSRWWGCSRRSLHALEEMTETFEIASLTMRRSLAIFEELESLNQSLTLKSYVYRHGTGLGKTSVGYHDSSLTLESVTECIKTKLIELLKGFSAIMSKVKPLPENKQEIAYLLPSLPLLLPLASVPLRENLRALASSQATTIVLSLSDWRELWSIICQLCSNTQSGWKFRSLKNETLKRLRVSELRGRYSSGESAWFVDRIQE